MKNKIFKSTIALFFVISICVSFVGCKNDAKEQLPTPSERFFINDFASVMTETDVNTIYANGTALQQATTAQAVVVTIEGLNGTPIEEYALNIGREWAVGAEDKDNGVVILLSKSDREIYIAVGYGLEGALPDSKTARIIDNYDITYFADDNFSAGLVSVYNAIVNEIYIEYGMQPSGNYVPADLLPYSENETTSVGKVALSWMALIVLVMLYTIIFGRHGGFFIFGSPRFFTGGFHGGFGGGSSGGFGGFKGGGGSFGGGGAGRKF